MNGRDFLTGMSESAARFLQTAFVLQRSTR